MAAQSMRHRSDARLFVDTAPRPAHRRPVALASAKQPARDWGPYRAAVAAVLALALLAGGVSVANRNSTAGMHMKIAEGYQQSVLDWEEQHLPTVQGTAMSLLFNGSLSVPVHLTLRPAKPVVLKESAAQQQLQDQGLRVAKPPKITSMHADFAATGILKAVLSQEGTPLLLHPSWVADEQLEQQRKQQQQPAGPGSRRRVSEEMLGSTRVVLLVDPTGQAQSWEQQQLVNLGSFPFARIRVVHARSQGDCVNHQWGMWDKALQRCTVVDYLAELCFKLQFAEGADGAALFRLDYSHGGTGCDPRLDWQPETWKRARTHPVKPPSGAALVPLSSTHSWESFLPAEAGLNAPRVVIRHARDPELEGRHLVNSLTKATQPAFVWRAIGLGMVFVGLVILFMLACFSIPATRAMLKTRVGDDDDD